jgi:hypothetical protein
MGNSKFFIDKVILCKIKENLNKHDWYKHKRGYSWQKFFF